MDRREFISAAAAAALGQHGCRPEQGATCIDTRGLQLPPQHEAALNALCNPPAKEKSMSYSTIIKAPSKATTLVKLSTFMAATVASQPIHAHDMPRVLVAAEEMLKPLMDPPDGFEVQLTISGSVGSGGVPSNPAGINTVGIQIAAYVAPKVI